MEKLKTSCFIMNWIVNRLIFVLFRLVTNAEDTLLSDHKLFEKMLSHKFERTHEDHANNCTDLSFKDLDF